MQEWIINVLNQFGYFGIAALIAIENIFPPIPSEVILTFSGFMTTYTEMNEWMVVLASTPGSLIGAILLYEVGSLVSQERLAKLAAGKSRKDSPSEAGGCVPVVGLVSKKRICGRLDLSVYPDYQEA